MEFLAVISEDSMIPLCNKYGIDYVFYKNQPLGEKKNFGLTEAFKKDWDYLVELGSDDLIKNEYLEVIKPHLGEQLLGINNLAFINSETGECNVMQTNTWFGLCRMIRRDSLEKITRGVEFAATQDIIAIGRTVNSGKVGFFPKDQALDFERSGFGKIVSEEKHKLWNDNQQTGLDNNSSLFMAVNGILGKKIKCNNPVAIDIKGPDNIWPYNPAAGFSCDLETLLTGLSNDEQSAIATMIKRNQTVEYA